MLLPGKTTTSTFTPCVISIFIQLCNVLLCPAPCSNLTMLDWSDVFGFLACLMFILLLWNGRGTAAPAASCLTCCCLVTQKAAEGPAFHNTSNRQTQRVFAWASVGSKWLNECSGGKKHMMVCYSCQVISIQVCDLVPSNSCLLIVPLNLCPLPSNSSFTPCLVMFTHTCPRTRASLWPVRSREWQVRKTSRGGRGRKRATTGKKRTER